MRHAGLPGFAGSVRRQEVGIVQDLPEMGIGVLEISGISAPESLLRGLHEARSGGEGALHRLIHFPLAPEVVTERELARTRRRRRYSGVMGEIGPREQAHFETALEVEEGDG